MPSERVLSLIEGLLFAILLVYLVWIPLPFGSVIETAQVPLVIFPIFSGCIASVTLFARARKGQVRTVAPAFAVWTLAAVVFALVVAIQILPLPASLVRSLSPSAGTIWDGARDAARFVGVEGGFRLFRFSVAPEKTAIHLLRFLAYFGVYLTAAAVVRDRWQRITLALVLGGCALFQVVYGLNEWYAGTDSIWGWHNVKIHNRVTGTFVNPNHFAHYLGIVLPAVMYVVISQWKRRSRFGGSPAERIATFIERDFLSVGVASALVVACLGGVLVAQSRGALLSILVGVTLAIGLTRRTMMGPPAESRHEPRWLRRLKRRLPVPLLRLAGLPAFLRAGSTGLMLILIVVSLVLFIGVDRTIARFLPSPEETVTLVGRTRGIEAALGVWGRFVLVGSGLGTFDDVVLMAQDPLLDKIYTHAHNDYLEIAATTGILGFVGGIGGLLAGAWIFARRLRREVQSNRQSDRRHFRRCAAASLAVALVHATLDFNFFIPANPATLAAIMGAAVAFRLDDGGENQRSERWPGQVAG